MAVGGLARWLSRVPWEQFRSGNLSESIAQPFVDAGVIHRSPPRMSYEGSKGTRNTEFFNQVLNRTRVDERFTRALPFDPSRLSPAEAERLVSRHASQRAIIKDVAEKHRKNFYATSGQYRESAIEDYLKGTGLGDSATEAIEDIAMRQILEDAYFELGINPLRRFGHRQSIDNTLGLLGRSEHTVNAHPKGVIKFFQEGRLKNAFDSRTSSAHGGVEGGMRFGVDPLYLYNRALSESRFGIPRDAPGSARPTYGFRSIPDHTGPEWNDPWARLAPWAQDYGPVQLRFGPSVDARSTFSFQDTMNPNEFGNLYNVIPRPIIGAQPEDAALAGYRFSKDSPYIESQVWGAAPSVDELSSIGAYPEVAGEVAKWMEKVGIRVPFRVFDYEYPGGGYAGGYRGHESSY